MKEKAEDKARRKLISALTAVVTDLGKLRDAVGKVEGRVEKVLEVLEPAVDSGEVDEED